MTELEQADLVALARAFGVGELEDWRRIEAGTINANYRVETAAGRWFLRVNEGKEAADVAYEVELVGELRRLGVPTPAMVATASGERVVWRAGRPVNLFEWADGEHLAEGELEPAHLEKLGAALAALHRAGDALGQRFHRESIYTTERIAERFEGFAGSTDARVAAAVPVLGAELERLGGERPGREALPRTVIHGDLFPDNVLFAGGELLALLDFEQASGGAALYDLAVCLNAWCFVAGALVADLARGLLRGYLGARALPELSPRALWIECRAAALRFAVTRITDVHLAGLERSGKDFADYLTRLAAWHELGPGLGGIGGAS